ncbi:MAG: FG-GAP-like repeat-containing protein, partial [Gammaproteobacteria bacterium]|nr:FG-GAP-like repeat-containing protein [Gammaproteobacteria bacterium]
MNSTTNRSNLGARGMRWAVGLVCCQVRFRPFRVQIGHRRRVDYVLVIVALSVATAACVGQPVAEDTSDERYVTVGHLIAERELAAALKHTHRYLRDRPNDSLLLTYRGEILYRMQRFPEALEAFAAARKHAPHSPSVLYRKWRAMRAQAVTVAESRAEIEADIAAMLMRGGNQIGALTTAYRGYGLLRMWDQQRRLVPRLLTAPVIDGNGVAELLTEELFTIRDHSERLDLAHRLVQRFPDHRHAPRIAAVLLRELDRKHADSSTLRHTIEPFMAAARHTEYWITPLADLLLRRGQVDAAAELLALAGESTPVTPYDYGAIPSEARRRAARTKYLKGMLAYRQRRWQDAEALFAQSIRDYPRDAEAQFYAGETAYARGDADAALDYFVAALREQPVAAAEDRLRELLRGRADVAADPAQYFSRAEGQVRFQDLTAQWGMEGVAARQLAWGDYDNDGFDDLLVDGTRIYRNVGGRGLVQVNDKLGIPERIKGVGIWLDTDDDGDLDLVSASARHFELWRNDADGFTAVTEAAFPDRPSGPITAIAAGDIDNDGRLDLYLAKYELGVERGFCAPDQLFRNRGRNR